MKTILLTGISGGIGSAIARSLEGEEMEVVGVDRAMADLTSYQEIQGLATSLERDRKRFDWLVFSHGFIDTQTVLENQRPEDIEATFRLNVISDVYLTQVLLGRMHPSGGIIFLSSTAALTPNGRYAVYSASKAAVNAFAQALARNRPELTIYSVCPGPTNTAMRIKIGDTSMKSQSPDIVASLVKRLIQGTTPYKSGDIIALRDGAETRVSGI